MNYMILLVYLDLLKGHLSLMSTVNTVYKTLEVPVVHTYNPSTWEAEAGGS
jgi:hypothetical protein